MVLTENKKVALYAKMDNPDKEVKCPRCGNEIIYVVRGTSISVECKTPNCIFIGVRGI